MNPESETTNFIYDESINSRKYQREQKKRRKKIEKANRKRMKKYPNQSKWK